MNSSELIHHILQQYHISQAELAKLLNVREGTLSRWKNGIHPAPLQFLCLLAHYFNIPLAEAIDYEVMIAPYVNATKLYQSPQVKKTYAEAEENCTFAQTLALAEDLQEGQFTYTQLLQDASLSHFELKAQTGGADFKPGDLLFYRKESVLSDGYVLFQKEHGQIEILYLKHTGREILLKGLNVQDEVLNFSKDGRKSGHILGHIHYIVRRFKAPLPQ